ncbi:MAG: fumarylacetoacetate hydrolase [Lautropia sp.]|nr:fumarylacetoacetate hydrolase [Lautropia sp.]
MAWVLGAVLGVGMAAHAAAACLSDEAVAQWVQHYEARTPATNPPAGMTAADAACTRAKLQAAIEPKLGKAVGYKAGLTNPAVQKRFNTDQPVWGRLYEANLVESGATVPAKFGARGLFEGDLLVRVASADINRAKTPEDVLAAVDQIIPFMELPDLLVENPKQLDGAGITAINVGARLGVMGKPLPVPADHKARQSLLAELREMKVVLKDDSGKELTSGKGSDVLGQPLNAVVWLAGALAESGQTLKPGDLVSLGSFSALLPPEAGLRVTLDYEGLTGAEPVVVKFE